MTLVPQTDNKLQRHLVPKFRTKKICCISAEIWYGGRNLTLICAYQISAKTETKKILQKDPVFVVAFKTSDERSPFFISF